jgi:hypothetical protein
VRPPVEQLGEPLDRRIRPSDNVADRASELAGEAQVEPGTGQAASRRQSGAQLAIVAAGQGRL